MRRFFVVLLGCALLVNLLVGSQETAKAAPFPLDEIIDFHKSDVPCRRLTVLIRDRGVDFPATPDALSTLRSAGICPAAIEEVVKRGKEVEPKRPVAGITERIKAATGYLDEGRYAAAVEVFEKVKANTHNNQEVLSVINKAQKAAALEKSLPTNGRFRLEDIDRFLGVLTPKRLTTLVVERGILCVPSQHDTEKLTAAGVDDRVIIAIEKKGLENERQGGKLFETAKSLFEEGSYDQAIGTLEKARNICPSDKQTLVNIENVRRAQTAESTLNRASLGLEELTILLKQGVPGKRIARLIGQRDINFSTLTDENEKRLREAGADQQVVVAIQTKLVSKRPLQRPDPIPNEAIRLVNIGAEMIRQQKFQEALDQAGRALIFSKRYDKAWELHGDALRGFQRFSDALASYDKALEIDPAEPLIWAKRGMALHDLSKHQEAVQSFDKALDINPANQAIWIFRGDTLLAMKKCEDARGSYDKALEINSKLQLTLMSRYDQVKQCAQ